MRTLTRSILACSFASLISHSHAADTLYAYDGFNYAIGSALVGLNGGSGWSSAWADNTSGTGGSIVAGLSYTDALNQTLQTTGGALSTDPGIFFSQQTRGTLQSFGAAGTSVWMSFLVQQSANPTVGVNYASATVGTGYTFGSPAMAGGIGVNPGVGAFYSSSETANVPSIVVAAQSVSLVVLQFSFANSGNDTISLWFNPVLGGNPGAPAVSASLRDYAPVISGVTLAHGDFRTFAYDELRIGSSFAAVTPAVPEPMSLTLWTAGLAGVWLRARRSAAATAAAGRPPRQPDQR